MGTQAGKTEVTDNPDSQHQLYGTPNTAEEEIL